LEQRGYRVIRFTNHEVQTNIGGVLHQIARQCGVRTENR
jgi:very-short-patch-repair endonuclease